MAGIDSISESAPIDIEVTGAQGPRGVAGPNSVTSATTSDGAANLDVASLVVRGLLTAGHIHGNIAGTLYTHVRTSEIVAKGDPVYVSGFHSGTNQPIVSKADAGNPARMPAIGVMDAAYPANTSSANCVIAGNITDVNTNAFSVNAPVYVANGGGFSATVGTVPQQVGVVERSNLNNGAFIVTSNKVIVSADISDATANADLNPGKAVKTDANGTTTLRELRIKANEVAGSGLLYFHCDNGEIATMVYRPVSIDGSNYILELPFANGTIAVTDNQSGTPVSEVVPANASATGIAGKIAFDSSYVYICVAANTWKRAALSTW